MRRYTLALALCALIAGCEQSTSPMIASLGGGGGGKPRKALLVSPSQVEIAVAQSVQLSTNFGGAPTDWSSSDAGVASVSAFGLVTGMIPGVAKITARVENDGSRVGSATVIVKGR